VTFAQAASVPISGVTALQGLRDRGKVQPGQRPGFTKPQLVALSLGFLQLNNAGNLINSSLWGLWLLPFGILVIKSGFIPKFIGYFLILGCLGYLVNSVTYILWPQYLHTVNNITLPISAPGELFMLLWLLIKGGRVPLPAA
jgi:hypothetical protein